MLDKVIVKRNKNQDELQELELTISEKDFFIAYDEIDKDSAYDLLKKYLIYSQDDGIPRDIETSYNNKEKRVTITTQLHYIESRRIPTDK